MTNEREDITPEQWVDILGKEDNFLYTICRATAFGDVEMVLHRVGDGPANCNEVEIEQGNARTSLEARRLPTDGTTARAGSSRLRRRPASRAGQPR